MTTTAAPTATAPATPQTRSQWQLFRRRFFRHRLAMLGLIIIIGLFVICFGARWIAPYRRNGIDLGSPASGNGGSGSGSLLDDLLRRQDSSGQGTGPSKAHWFGTDVLGRDYLTEILYAGQISLKVGLAVAVLSTSFGTALGSLAGYFGKAVDQTISRVIDLFLIVPSIALLAVAIQKLGQSDTTVILALAGLGWMTVARVVRGQAYALREREFVDAARIAGASSRRIIFRHLLPNMIGPVMVAATFNMAAAIVAESTLSFLGYGIQPPKTSWGNMLSAAEEFAGTSKAYLLYFPGLLILLTVLAANFLGDGLRDAFDPQARR